MPPDRAYRVCVSCVCVALDRNGEGVVPSTTMTLGLATGDEYGLYLAIDSKNVPMSHYTDFPEPLASKLVEVQQVPVVALLVSGGLWNWCEVVQWLRDRAAYPEPLGDMAAAIDRRLKQCPKPEKSERPPSFGLVCGFEREMAVCYRVSSVEGAIRGRFELKRGCVVSTGMEAGFGEQVAAEAERSIGERAADPLSSVVAAIENQLPHPDLDEPVERKSYAAEREIHARG
jgi:hypothetical protein